MAGAINLKVARGVGSRIRMGTGIGFVARQTFLMVSEVSSPLFGSAGIAIKEVWGGMVQYFFNKSDCLHSQPDNAKIYHLM